MKGITTIIAYLAGTAACSAQIMLHDPPWNPEHINHLPSEVRKRVLAMCPTMPAAGHYFAIYDGPQLVLHFEHFHCGVGPNRFCRDHAECLHQIYTLRGGHYSLTGSVFGSAND
jgi:hypothetical protein